AARTSKRLVGQEGSVVVIYRRKIHQMPADPEEIRALIDEGISIIELAAPLKVIQAEKQIQIVCQKMELGDLDSSGRRRPIPIDGSEFTIDIDSMITAIGQNTVLDFIDDKVLKLRKDGETQFDNVFAGGDATRGADSLINAIADGKNAAEVITARANDKLSINYSREENKISLQQYQKKQAERIYGKGMPELNLKGRESFDLVHPNLNETDAINEAERCLYCNDVCNICVGVCPNFANVSYESKKASIPVYSISSEDLNDIKIDGHLKINQTIQIFNIGDFCNECGNCTTFCPTSGDPYLVKPKFYLTEKSFSNEDDCYYLSNNKIKFKKNGNTEEIELLDGNYLYTNGELDIQINSDTYQIINIKFKSDPKPIILEKMSELIYLLENLNRNAVFT
ncbi:MAG: hypothetical protein R3250_12660, partial [Melioribacteraceae bacterium]|nr:hypothetical protein [Melioribacteraceae bacterium]